MSDGRPLLVFPASPPGPIPTGRPTPRDKVQGPGAARQGARLTPRFEALEGALAAGRATADAGEADPALVVVFEVAGDVAGFARAVELVPGLEFLAELADEQANPDDDFVVLKEGASTAKPVPLHLSATFSDARAAKQLVTLFKGWVAQPDVKFRQGWAPLRNAFAQLHDVRLWSAQDRVRETGLLQDWAEDVAVVGGTNAARAEIELWFRSSRADRAAAQTAVEATLQSVGATLVNSSELPGIGYHALLADIPYDAVRRVLADGPEAIDLLLAPAVMLVSSTQPWGSPQGRAGLEAGPTTRALPRDVPARVALLDGVPLANHQLLEGRLTVDDPDDCAATYDSALGQQHGTHMASLLCHGDSLVGQSPLDTPLHVQPILVWDPGRRGEYVSQDELLVDVLHRAFRRMKEGSVDQEPTAPGVRIVNLSIGDARRAFDRRMSPAARLLDWISLKYNLLVVVSSGNHAHDLTLSAAEVAGPGGVLGAARTAGLRDARYHRLLSPGEAVNVLTVGALHEDSAVSPVSDLIVDPLPPGDLATYSARGGGLGRSVKPEVLMPGGRQLFQAPLLGLDDDELLLRTAQQAAVGPGLVVAAPSTGGGTRGTSYIIGTSAAAALTSRLAHDTLATLESQVSAIDAQYHPILTKALLVHGSSWGKSGKELQQHLNHGRREFSTYYGYGAVVPARVAAAARERAVVVGAGTLHDGLRQEWRLPLPPALAATTDWRRLTVTLAWFSPTNHRSQRYRSARLKLIVPSDPVGTARVEIDHDAASRGTVQHEVYEGVQAVPFFEGDDLVLHVECRVDGVPSVAGVRYGLAVSLEVAPTLQVDLQAQLQAGLVRTRARVQPRSA